jgi:hypothetical protein
MKYALLPILLFFFSTSLNAQSFERHPTYLRAYGNFLYLNGYHIPDLSLPMASMNGFLNFSGGLSWQNPKNGIVNELGVGYYRYQSTAEDGTMSDDRVFEARYEIGGYVDKKLFNKITFRLSKSVRFFYASGEADGSPPPLEHRRTTQSVGINFSYIPHIEIHLFGGVILDVSTSVLGTSWSVVQTYVENPALTENQRTFGGFDMDAFGHRLFRLGIGVPL